MSEDEWVSGYEVEYFQKWSIDQISEAFIELNCYIESSYKWKDVIMKWRILTVCFFLLSAIKQHQTLWKQLKMVWILRKFAQISNSVKMVS